MRWSTFLVVGLVALAVPAARAQGPDRREDARDRAEDRRDRSEDVRDAANDGGTADDVEDLLDSMEDVLDRMENWRDRFSDFRPVPSSIEGRARMMKARKRLEDHIAWLKHFRRPLEGSPADRREDAKDKAEDARDKAEDGRDAANDGGRLDRMEDFLDRFENVRDRLEDRRERPGADAEWRGNLANRWRGLAPEVRTGLWDQVEDVWDRAENVRDRRENRRDAATDNGPRDKTEDRRDKAEDKRDRAEDRHDRRHHGGRPGGRRLAPRAGCGAATGAEGTDRPRGRAHEGRACMNRGPPRMSSFRCSAPQEALMQLALTPRQQNALKTLSEEMQPGRIVLLWGKSGLGKSTVLREAYRRTGGALVTMKELVDLTRQGHPLAIASHLRDSGKILVAATHGAAPDAWRTRGQFVGMEEFTAEDYRALCAFYLGEERSRGVDYAKVRRYAHRLNAYQLRATCACYEANETPTTETMIEVLRMQRLTSNVHLQAVEDVDLDCLRGVDDVIRALETHIVLPLENDALAQELDLRPKRGVLLVGPPGTGKTTVGRALAHRLRGKFFRIDGTIIAGTSRFYGEVNAVFEAARQNAPSVIFVDDSDVIFQDKSEYGLYRYLLTQLDGLETKSEGHVCVMMTAMDVSHLPPALVRSGRIELWLEMRLPDDRARGEILGGLLAKAPPALAGAETPRVVAATGGFTGADLKRLVEDAKMAYAADRAAGREAASATAYLVGASEEVRRNQERYRAAEAQAARHVVQGDPMSAMMIEAMARDQAAAEGPDGE